MAKPGIYYRHPDTGKPAVVCTCGKTEAITGDRVEGGLVLPPGWLRFTEPSTSLNWVTGRVVQYRCPDCQR